MSLIAELRAAAANPTTVAAARDAIDIVRTWSRAAAPQSGSDTGARMLARIHSGMSTEEAAAREYAYRWHLCLNQWVNHVESRSRSRPICGAWPVPHAIGMDGVE